MSVGLCWEQCCETAGCTKPALHGVLCAPCFYAAGPARRAVELLGAEPLAPPGEAFVDDRGVEWLARIWAA